MTKLDGEPLGSKIDRKGLFPRMAKGSLHKHNGIYFL